MTSFNPGCKDEEKGEMQHAATGLQHPLIPDPGRSRRGDGRAVWSSEGLFEDPSTVQSVKSSVVLLAVVA